MAVTHLPTHKAPPHSLEAEQAVLGGLMLDNSAWEEVAEIITESDFYREDHRLIYRSISALGDEGEPRDLVTLTEWLRSRKLLDDAGGTGYLGHLAKETPSAANIKAYAKIVRDTSVLRALIAAGTHITEIGFSPEGRESEELLDEAEREVFAIAESARSGVPYRQINELLKDAMERIEELAESGGKLTGLPTGLTRLDKLTNGLQRGDLIIVAGRPSMGKTSLAMNIVEHVAVAKEVPALVFSMEMSAGQLVNRMISSLGRVNQSALRTGELRDEDWPRITSTVTLMHKAPLFIDDTPSLSPNEIRARARRLKREHNIGLIMVDYLQLMQVPGTKENRTNEISEISRGLKALARELDVPVIALSQLNRAVEQREDKRPRMADLRDSGGIEQDADLITFIYRDEVYHEDTEDKGIAEVIIGKQRNGPLGICRAAFFGEYTRFDNLEDRYEAPDYDGSGG